MNRTLIAAAVLAAASGSAFAGGLKDPYIFNTTLVGEQVGISGWVTLFGCVDVSSTAGAVINNTQTVWTNASLSPNAQSFTKGSVTTTVNDTSSSVNASGAGFASLTQSHTSAKARAQGSESSSAYAFENQSSAASSGGYQHSQQSSSIAGGFSNASQDQGGKIAASGQIEGSYSVQDKHDHHGSSGSFKAQGGLSGGYSASSYANAQHVAGSYEGSEGSGQGSAWKSSADQGSGSKASAEQSSSYALNASTKTDSVAAVWGLTSSVATTDVKTSGKVTQFIDTQTPGTLTATTGSGAASGVSGNIGINIAEGVDNAQSNDASLASVDAGNVFGNAQIFNIQSSGGSAKISNFNVNASIGDNSLQGASGNVGVNVASGIGNVQNNSLAASTSTMSKQHSDVAMVATDQNDQSASLAFTGQFEGTAMLGANTLSNASGNIGVNIAGGAGNLQHNGLAIAAMNVSSK